MLIVLLLRVLALLLGTFSRFLLFGTLLDNQHVVRLQFPLNLQTVGDLDQLLFRLGSIVAVVRPLQLVLALLFCSLSLLNLKLELLLIVDLTDSVLLVLNVMDLVVVVAVVVL